MRIRAPWGEYLTIPATAEAIWRVLERGVGYALGRSEFGPVPDPYRADIAYRREPMRQGRRRDYYQPFWEVVQQKHGDCEDLAQMLTAWLRQTGTDPTARVALIEWPGGGWHAVVARRGKAPGSDETYDASDLTAIYGSGAALYAGPDWGWNPRDVYVVDPSRRLGMKDPARLSLYSPQASELQREGVKGWDPYLPFELEGVRGLSWRDVLDIFGR